MGPGVYSRSLHAGTLGLLLQSRMRGTMEISDPKWLASVTREHKRTSRSVFRRQIAGETSDRDRYGCQAAALHSCKYRWLRAPRFDPQYSRSTDEIVAKVVPYTPPTFLRFAQSVSVLDVFGARDAPPGASAGTSSVDPANLRQTLASLAATVGKPCAKVGKLSRNPRSPSWRSCFFDPLDPPYTLEPAFRYAISRG